MDQRVLEICYDIAAIPGRNLDNPADPRVSRFRDAAMERIDEVLLDDGLGRRLDANLSEDRLRLRFVVEDFDAAEARVGTVTNRFTLARPVEVLKYWHNEAVI